MCAKEDEEYDDLMSELRKLKVRENEINNRLMQIKHGYRN